MQYKSKYDPKFATSFLIVAISLKKKSYRALPGKKFEMLKISISVLLWYHDCIGLIENEKSGG